MICRVRLSSAVVSVLCLAALAAAAAPPAPAPAAVPAAGLAGHWEGVISVQGLELGLKTDFARAGEAWTGTFDIVQQGAVGIPLAAIRCEGGAVHFEIASNLGQAVFEGRLEGDRVEGSFTQGAAAGTFSLARGAAAADEAAARGAAGDEVAADDGVRREQLALVTATGTLYATLDLPPGAQTFPAVLVIPGSGPTDRDGNSPLLPGRNDSLKMIGRALAARGIAALRVDKRGVAASAAAGADEAKLSFDDYIADAASWIGRLQQDPRVTRVAVLGHSEGSLVGMVAAHEAGADAFVSVAGAGRPIDETLIEQLGANPGVPMDEVRRILAELKAGRTAGEVPAGLESLFRTSVQPYLISWLRLDPAARIAKLQVPVLILQGDRDLQVTPDDARRLQAAKRDARLAIVPGMNHVLKSVAEGPAANAAAYSDPTLPLAEGFTGALIGFLTEVLADR